MTATTKKEGTERFTMGLVIDVAKVLDHGYGPFEDGRCYVELQQRLLQLLHGQHDACSGGRLDGAR